MKIFVAGATDAVGFPLVRAVHPGSRGHGHDARRPSGVVAPAMWARCPRESIKCAGWNWKFGLAMLSIGSGNSSPTALISARNADDALRRPRGRLETHFRTRRAWQESIVTLLAATSPRPSSVASPKADTMHHANNSIALVEHAFARDVVGGLSADVKTLPSRRLYDERGSALFEEITRQDEYYLTRAETSILRERQSHIADFVESGVILIEHGAGAGVKTELVLAGLRDPRGYVPIDITDAFLAETSKRIASRFPSLWVRPIERNFLDVFEVPFDGSGGGRTGFFSGSTMGNLNAIEAKSLLTQTGRHRRRTRHHRCRSPEERRYASACLRRQRGCDGRF